MFFIIDCLKVFHVFSVIAFMAGIFYLPRIFVYHADVKRDSDNFKLFCIMERRLIKYIMTPAIILFYITGACLAFCVLWMYQKKWWFIIKMFCVFFMTVFYFICWKFVKDFEKGKCNRTSLFFRFFNEIPTILLLIILFMIYLKPL